VHALDDDEDDHWQNNNYHDKTGVCKFVPVLNPLNITP
jgi:hypothetical protein